MNLKPKTRRIIYIALMALPTFALFMSGILNLTGFEPDVVLQVLTKAGFGQFVKVVGATELICAGLFVYPRTYKIGFLLICCYLGGALAIEVSTGQPMVSGVFLILIWSSLFVRNQEMFIESSSKKTT